MPEFGKYWSIFPNFGFRKKKITPGSKKENIPPRICKYMPIVDIMDLKKIVSRQHFVTYS